MNVDDQRVMAAEAADHAHPAPAALSPYAFRMYAMRDLLIEKGFISADAVQQGFQYFAQRGRAMGAKIVARAWTDAAFKQRLLTDAKSACEEIGIDTNGLKEFVVLENRPSLRHLVLCTLCSCYPRQILGQPPDWYKSLSYRARAVSEPRAVMAEFGGEPAADVEVRVVDSTADVRYMVLPVRPAGTDHFSESELAELVSRDSLVGVVDVRQRD